jgi:hypothetical protein
MPKEIKIAEKLADVTEFNLSPEILGNEYLNKFATKMMLLSNRLNEIEDDNDFADDLDIKEDYLPAIREFIWNITMM